MVAQLVQSQDILNISLNFFLLIGDQQRLTKLEKDTDEKNKKARCILCSFLFSIFRCNSLILVVDCTLYTNKDNDDIILNLTTHVRHNKIHYIFIINSSFVRHLLFVNDNRQY